MNQAILNMLMGGGFNPLSLNPIAAFKFNGETITDLSVNNSPPTWDVAYIETLDFSGCIAAVRDFFDKRNIIGNGSALPEIWSPSLYDATNYYKWYVGPQNRFLNYETILNYISVNYYDRCFIKYKVSGNVEYMIDELYLFSTALTGNDLTNVIKHCQSYIDVDYTFDYVNNKLLGIDFSDASKITYDVNGISNIVDKYTGENYTQSDNAKKLAYTAGEYATGASGKIMEQASDKTILAAGSVVYAVFNMSSGDRVLLSDVNSTAWPSLDVSNRNSGSIYFGTMHADNLLTATLFGNKILLMLRINEAAQLFTYDDLRMDVGVNQRAENGLITLSGGFSKIFNRLFGNDYYAWYAVGNIYEMGFAANPLTTIQLLSIKNYLLKKHSITNSLQSYEKVNILNRQSAASIDVHLLSFGQSNEGWGTTKTPETAFTKDYGYIKGRAKNGFIFTNNGFLENICYGVTNNGLEKYSGGETAAEWAYATGIEMQLAYKFGLINTDFYLAKFYKPAASIYSYWRVALSGQGWDALKVYLDAINAWATLNNKTINWKSLIMINGEYDATGDPNQPTARDTFGQNIIDCHAALETYLGISNLPGIIVGLDKDTFSDPSTEGPVTSGGLAYVAASPTTRRFIDPTGFSKNTLQNIHFDWYGQLQIADQVYNKLIELNAV